MMTYDSAGVYKTHGKFQKENLTYKILISTLDEKDPEKWFKVNPESPCIRK